MKFTTKSKIKNTNMSPKMNVMVAKGAPKKSKGKGKGKKPC